MAKSTLYNTSFIIPSFFLYFFIFLDVIRKNVARKKPTYNQKETMGDSILILSWIVLVWVTCLRTEECVQRVYVDNFYNQSCAHVSETGNDWRCRSLDDALHDLKTINSTCIYLPKNTTLNDTRALEYVDGLSISSIGNDSWSILTCKNSSLRFKYSSNINFFRLTLQDCGEVFEIDWKYESHKIIETESINVSAAITFERCSAVKISHVKLHSSSGYGILVKDSNFIAVNRTSIVHSRYVCVKYANESFEMGGGIFVYYHDNDDGNNNRFNVWDSNLTTAKFLSGLNSVRSPDKLPYGKGGGIHLAVASALSGNSVRIERARITENSANDGAGMFVRFLQNSRHNNVTLCGCLLADNIANEVGGGFYARVHSENNNSIVVSSSHIENNQANVGGGISLVDMLFNSTSAVSKENFLLHGLTLNNNMAQLGTSMHAQNIVVNLTDFWVSKSNIRPVDYLPGQGTVYALRSTLRFNGRHNMFYFNNNSAIVLDSSIMYVEGGVEFLENFGYNGGALVLYEHSTLYLTRTTDLLFKQNTAWNKGGAIYVQMPGPSLLPWSSTELNIYDCFIKFVEGEADAFEGSCTFTENKCMNSDSHDIFTSSLQSCRRPSDHDRLEIIAHWHNFKFDNNTPAISTNAISIMELDVNEWTSYPGDLLQPHIILRDERNNSVSESIDVIIVPQNVAKIETNPAFVVDSDESIKLTLINTTADRSKTFVVSVKTTSDVFLESNLSNVKFRPCPFGFTQSDGSATCECNVMENEDLNIALCDDKSIYLFRNIWVDSKEKQTYTCPPGSCRSSVRSEENRYTQYNKDSQCADDRDQKSRLCSKCIPGYSAVSSKHTCMSCPKDSIGWVWVTLAMALGLSLFIGLVMAANIDIMSYNLNICIYSYQVIDLLYTYEQKVDPFLSFVMTVFQVTPRTSVFPHVCLWYGMNSLDKIAMSYFIPGWMLIFMAILYFSLQKKQTWMDRWYKTISIVLIMCFSYLLRLSFQLLHSVEIDGKLYVYEYADVEYFGSRHMGYGVAAVTVLFVIALFSIAHILLICKSKVVMFEWLRRFDNKLKVHFNSGYRWFWTFYFVCRLFIYAFAIFLTNYYRIQVALLALTCFAICIVVSRLRPYEDDTINLAEAFVLLVLTIISIINMGIRTVFLTGRQEDFEISVQILSYVPLLVLVLSVGKHVYETKSKRVNEMQRRGT